MAWGIDKKIIKKISKYQNIVVARHTGPDPDAIASQIALRDSIRLTFPNKNVIAVGTGVSKFKKFGLLDKSDFTNIKNALLIITDVPTMERVDGIEGLDYKEIIKIDHHPCDEAVADVELVDDSASSACQLIAKLILTTKLKLNKEIASNLFLGIISDSDRFLISYTSVETFKIVTCLIEESGIDFVNLYDKLYERNLNEIKFHGYLAEHLTVNESGLGYVIISPEVLKEYKVDTATPSNMINDFNYIKDCLAWTFLTYDDKKDFYKVSIRSRGPIINEVASNYNGGGHKFASGAKIYNEEDIPKFLNDLDVVCQEYKDKINN
jgi:phosphoesterase RecJ-like protein